MTTILLIDDSPVFRTALHRAIARLCPISVIRNAGDGTVGLARAVEDPPDVAFIDMAMPALNGCDTARALRRQYPRARLILMSVEHPALDAAVLADCGADAFVNKDALFPQLPQLLDRRGNTDGRTP